MRNQVDRERHVRRRAQEIVEELEIQHRDERNLERNRQCWNSPQILLQNEIEHEHQVNDAQATKRYNKQCNKNIQLDVEHGNSHEC